MTNFTRFRNLAAGGCSHSATAALRISVCFNRSNCLMVKQHLKSSPLSTTSELGWVGGVQQFLCMFKPENQSFTPISPNVCRSMRRWESKQAFLFFTNYFCHFRVYHQEQKSTITLRRDYPKVCSVIFFTLPLSVAVQSSHLLPSDVIGWHVVQTSFITHTDVGW